MARQNERKMKLYMEAGLAVLLVLTIALASVSGRLSSQAHEKDKNKQEAAVQGEAEVYEKNKGNDQEKNEVKDQRENNAQNTAGNAEESQETNAFCHRFIIIHPAKHFYRLCSTFGKSFFRIRFSCRLKIIYHLLNCYADSIRLWETAA